MAKSDNWSTPPDLMAVLHTEFRFNLEVCAAADNRALPYCEYMGLDNGKDALVNPWALAPTPCEFGGQIVHQTVSYCNPPYSMLPAFVERAAAQTEGTHVLLIPAYTDTRYFQQIIAFKADEVRFLKGRLRFWENGKPGKDTARFSSAVVIFRQTQGMLSSCSIRFWDWRAHDGGNAADSGLSIE